MKRHRSGRIRNVDWLDKLTFRELEHINEREKKEMNSMFLRVEFPPITVDEKEVTVIYYEEVCQKFVMKFRIWVDKCIGHDRFSK